MFHLWINTERESRVLSSKGVKGEQASSCSLLVALGAGAVIGIIVGQSRRATFEEGRFAQGAGGIGIDAFHSGDNCRGW